MAQYSEGDLYFMEENFFYKKVTNWIIWSLVNLIE